MISIFLACSEAAPAAAARAEYQHNLITLEQIVLEGRKLLNPLTLASSTALQSVLDRYDKGVCILCGLTDPDTECDHCKKWSWHAACSEGAVVPCILHWSSLWIRVLEKMQLQKCQTCDWRSAIIISNLNSSKLQYCREVLKKTMGHVSKIFVSLVF